MLEKKGIHLKTKVGHLNIVSPRAGVQRTKKIQTSKAFKTGSINTGFI